MSRRRRFWPPGTRWLAAGIGAVVLALAVAWVLFVPAADWLARHDVGSAHGVLLQTARDDARGRLLTLGAGLLAAGALVFTARNFTLARRNSEQADQWQRRTHELTEQGQVTDRYTKAIEQLGSEKLDVRIGGIYALERIARDSEKDHPTVVEVLTAFVRGHSQERWPPPDHPISQEGPRSIRPDVQAALTVVGRRDTMRDIRPIDARPIDLGGADLSGADLTNADLAHANLSGVHLSGANLSGAHLSGAHLSGADLGRADLSGADLGGADLTEATLVMARLTKTNLTGADLGKADLTGATLTHGRLAGAILTHAILYQADLVGAHLITAELGHANLGGADLGGVDLTAVNLTGANLAGADLRGTNFARANLLGANLRTAFWNPAGFGAANLTAVKWPEEQAVPEGWKRDANSGTLSRED